VSSARAELVGFTLANRPIYEAGLAHPTRFRTLLVQLPGTSTWARIDSPDFLESTIEAWRRGPAPGVCTTDERAAYALVRGGRISSTVDCPSMALSVSFKVISSIEFGATRALNSQRGPLVFNGLKGCNESAYGSR
jgi:hypothetical protein